MNFTNFFINRPRLAIVLNIFILLVGCIAFTKIKIKLLPNITSSCIQVRFDYNNCSPDYMETKIVGPSEKALKGLAGLEDICSSSVIGMGNLTLRFSPKIDIQNALNEVKDKIWGLQHIYPDDMKMPSITSGMDQNNPNIYLAVYSKNHKATFVTDTILDLIKPRLEQLPEVGEVKLMGGKHLGVHVMPIKQKIYQYNLDYSQIAQIVKNEVQEHPMGSIDDNKKYLITLDSKLDSVTERLDIIKNLVIKKYDNGSVLKVVDVCDVVFKEIKYDLLCRLNGCSTQFVTVSSSYDASDIDSSRAIQNLLPKIQKLLPNGIKIEELKNDGKTLKAGGIDKLYSVCIETILLVSIIVFLFLGSVQLTLIPIITIPISLAGSCIFSYLFGFSINMMTLISMVLAVGLVVDDSIIILENINRHKNKLNKTPIQAAMDGSNEISFAIIAITLTLFVVFLPFVFLEGNVSKLFNEFVWTLSFCVLLSGIVSLTLTPTLTRFAINEKRYKHNKIYHIINGALSNLQNKYEQYLILSIQYKKTFFATCVSFPILIIGLIFAFKINITPFSKEDAGIILINMQGPYSFTLADTTLCAEKMEKIFAEEKDVKFSFFVSTPNKLHHAFCYLKLKEKRGDINKLISRLNKKLSAIPDMKIFAVNPVKLGPSGSESNNDISFSVISPYANYENLKDTCDRIVEQMKKHDIFKLIDLNYPVVPALEVNIDQYMAGMYNINNNSIKKSLSDFTIDKNIGYITAGSKIYPILISTDKKNKKNINDLLSVLIKRESSTMLPLCNLANIDSSTTLVSNNHDDCFKSINISAQIKNKQSLIEIKSIIDNICSSILTEGSYIKYFGQIKQLESSKNTGLFLLIFSIIFIFLILGAQFESFICAFIILISIPFAFVGGLFSLLIFRDSVTMFSCIGLITLIGLVTKNAIMIVESANKLIKKDEIDVKNAILKASKLRLRPILMTSLATIAGSLLLTLGSGFGANSYKSIGLAITGGMIISTIFTIFIIPVVYYCLFKNKQISRNF